MASEDIRRRLNEMFPPKPPAHAVPKPAPSIPKPTAPAVPNPAPSIPKPTAPAVPKSASVIPKSESVISKAKRLEIKRKLKKLHPDKVKNLTKSDYAKCQELNAELTMLRHL